VETQNKIITIDGPAGAGKSTVAKALARTLGWTYLDTGALYRAVAVAAVRAGVEAADGPVLRQVLAKLDLKIAPGPDTMRVFLGEEEITGEIRQPHISALASDFSALAPVREALFGLQRRFGRQGQIVAEGRDMGTVVFPEAHVKFYLTATNDERARRRFEELQARNEAVSREQVLDDLIKRDEADSHRALSPLRPAEGAIVVDTTDMNIDQAVARLIEIVREKRN